MSDMYDVSFIIPFPKEDLYGLGVAGPPTPEEVKEPAERVIERENNENGDENIGRNVDYVV